MVAGGAAHQFRVAQRCSAENDAVDAERQPALDRVAVTDAAAELDPQINRAADRLCYIAIDRGAGKSPIEVDDVQPGKAGFGKSPGLRDRIAIEHRCARHVAAHETNAGPILQVDRRKEDHGAAGSASRSL